VTCFSVYQNDGTTFPKEIGKSVFAVTVQQVASQQSGVHAASIWKFLGNRFVEAHVCGNAQVEETELVEVFVSFAIIPDLLKLRSSRKPQFG
jgi:hypothetical protein